MWASTLDSVQMDLYPLIIPALIEREPLMVLAQNLRGWFVMRGRLSLLSILLVTATFHSGTSAAQTTTKNSNSQTSDSHHHVTITGCLTRGPHEEYELVDERGIHNLIYGSEKFNLDSYVGKSVTLVGNRSAVPSTDTGTARPMPHFRVRELRPGAGNCEK